MRKLLSFFPCLLLYWLLPLAGCGQTVTNVRAESKGNLVVVHYDLNGTAGQVFQVSLYCSGNQIGSPVVHVRGDVGPDIKPGPNKKITWGAGKELGQFTGPVTFRVEAKVTYAPLQPPVVNKVYRRGKSHAFAWQGGVAGENLRVELYRDTILTSALANLPNAQSFRWKSPRKLPLGTNYRLRISSVSSPGNYQYSDFFRIKRRTPAFWKAVPFGVVAAAVWFLLPDENNGPGVPPGDPDLPGAPDPTDQ